MFWSLYLGILQCYPFTNLCFLAWNVRYIVSQSFFRCIPGTQPKTSKGNLRRATRRHFKNKLSEHLILCWVIALTHCYLYNKQLFVNLGAPKNPYKNMVIGSEIKMFTPSFPWKYLNLPRSIYPALSVPFTIHFLSFSGFPS
jgi:hypothetical protein